MSWISAISSRHPDFGSVQAQAAAHPVPGLTAKLASGCRHLWARGTSGLPCSAQSWLSGHQGAAVGLAGGGGGGGRAELGEAAGAGFQAGHGAPGEEMCDTNITLWGRPRPGAHTQQWKSWQCCK